MLWQAPYFGSKFLCALVLLEQPLGKLYLFLSCWQCYSIFIYLSCSLLQWMRTLMYDYRLTNTFLSQWLFQKPSWEKAAKIIRERLNSCCILFFLDWKYDRVHSILYIVKMDIILILFHSKAHLQIVFRYDPEFDGRILLGKVDCTEEVELCRRYFLIKLLLFQ